MIFSSSQCFRQFLPFNGDSEILKSQLRFISDTFEDLHAKLRAGQGEYEGADPEDPDEYRAESVFWQTRILLRGCPDLLKMLLIDKLYSVTISCQPLSLPPP